MLYVKVNNQAVEAFPYSIGKLRADNTSVSFPLNPSKELLESYGVYQVYSAAAPAYDEATQKLVPANPTFDGTKWVFTYSVVELEAEEQNYVRDLKARHARERRNELMNESDWTVIRSVEMSTELAQSWKDYRQALRDIPSQPGFPFVVVWPQKPE